MQTVCGRNRFCGPAAYAAICGGTTDEAALAIRRVTGKRQVTGVEETHLVQALQATGLTVDAPMTPWPRARTLRALVDHLSPGLYLVLVSNHWVVVDAETRTACDSFNRVPVTIDRFRYPLRRVVFARRVRR